MVLERRSVAYCAKKIERLVQMGSLCFPLLCHYYVIFFQSQSSLDLRGICLPQVRVSCSGDHLWLNVPMDSLRSALASAGYCPTKLNSLKKPPEWLYLEVAIRVRISHPFSRQKMQDRGLLSRCVHYNG